MPLLTLTGVGGVGKTRLAAEATIQDVIARSARMFSEEGIGLFGVRMRGSEDLLGFCGFVRLEGMEEPELGYQLTRKAWGKGLATEASRACLRHAFEGAGMGRVIAGADAPNAASLRVIEKLGMGFVGNINASAPDDPYRALYREDFFARTQRKERDMNVEAELQEMGLVLPAPAKIPPGLVLPFSWVRVRGSRAYVSGHGHSTPMARWRALWARWGRRSPRGRHTGWRVLSGSRCSRASSASSAT